MKNITKVLVFILAVALVFGISFVSTMATDIPADGDLYTTVFFTPNAKWAEDDARFAVYCENGSESEWIDMYAVVKTTAIYSAEIPAKYDSFTFCSVNPEKENCDWADKDNIWFYTNPLTLPEGGSNHYVVATGAGSRGEGSWTHYEAAAKIGSHYFDSLQDAINAATSGVVEIEVLTEKISKNVEVEQIKGLYLTINGNGASFDGMITVDGHSAAIDDQSTTICNFNFDITSAEYCIYIPSGSQRYSNHLTVKDCTFSSSVVEDGDFVTVAIKQATAGCKNMVIEGCTVNSGMHSMLQASNIAGVKIDDCTVNSKNGINLVSSSNVEITNSTIDVSGYAVRAGASSGGDSGAIVLQNNLLKTSSTETEDAVVILRGAATTKVDLDMTENVIVGATHIKGVTEDTDITAELNFWSGETGAPVVDGSNFEYYEVYATEDKEGIVSHALHGAGTETDPILINSIQDLRYFRDTVNAGTSYAGKYVSVTASIDLAGEEWTPIGNSSNAFQGYFNANNNTISNLVITGNNSNVGLFGYTTNGEVKNLVVENALVSGRLNVAVVAGTPYTTKYTNIKVIGHVEVNGMAYVGGVGGKNAYANWTDITVDVDSTSYVSAVSTEDGKSYRTYVGGVIGFNGEGGHTFKNISSNIKVVGNVCDIGGIFGIAHYSNKFENIIFTGSVEAPEGAEEVGGIAGVWHNQAGTEVTFNNITSTGNVTVGETTVTGSIVGGAYNAENVAPGVSGSLIIDGKESWAGIAKIGDTYYATLADAIAAIGSGDVVIEILANATLDYNARDAYGLDDTTSVTIEGNGFVLTLNQKDSDWASIGLKNSAKLVLNNMTIEKTGYGDTSGAWNTHAIIFTCAIEMTDVTVNNAIVVENGAVLNNVNINEANGYYGLWISANGQEVSVNGGSITATNGGRGIKIADQYIDDVASVVLNIEGTVFTTAKKAAVLVSSTAGAVITASNVDINGVAEDSENVAWVDSDWSVYFGHVTVNGDLAEIEEGAEAYGAYVKVNGVEGYYADLNKAILAADNGTTIVILADIDLSATAKIPAGAELTIDLAGHIISGVSSETKATAVIENNGTLTIIDSIGGGKVTSKALNPDTNWGGEGQLAFPSYANNTIVNKGTLVLESGTIENTSAAGGATYAIDNYAGTITINGGSVYCENNIAIRFFANNQDMSLTVNGGEIYGKRALWVQLPSSNASIAPVVSVAVNGGTLSAFETADGYKLAIYSYSYGNSFANVSFSITGGTFNGDIALTGGSNKDNCEKLSITGGTFNGEIYSYASEDLAMEAITVSGGTFIYDRIAKYCAEDFKLIANVSNGTYCVVAAAETPIIGENGNWWIGGADTGLKADVEVDLTPYVGENGNWWIGDTDLGIPANLNNGDEQPEEKPEEKPCDKPCDQPSEQPQTEDNSKLITMTFAISTACICLTLAVLIYRGVKRRSWWCVH